MLNFSLPNIVVPVCCLQVLQASRSARSQQDLTSWSDCTPMAFRTMTMGMTSLLPNSPDLV